MAKLTVRQEQYLRAIQDWTAPCEIASKLGWSPLDGAKTMPHMGRLVCHGLAEWCGWHLAYRITPAGRAALTEGKDG